MSHFYLKTKDGWELSKSIDTLAKAKKWSKPYCASVTTKIALAPKAPQFYEWRDAEIVRLAREFPSLSASEVSKRTWGMRTCPETGEEISSSEFGTQGHKALEEFNINGITGGPYNLTLKLWSQWLRKEDVSIVEAEALIGCERRRVAGTIDFIGRMYGRIILCDYKFREARDLEHLKTKAYYNKDDMQLAIEARMIREQWKLDYTPRIYSILMNANEPMMYAKLWTMKAQAEAERKFEILNTFYNEWYGL